MFYLPYLIFLPKYMKIFQMLQEGKALIIHKLHNLENNTFFSKASWRTGSVRSLVNNRLDTLCGGLGSSNKPTLSQLPANDGAAKLKQDNDKYNYILLRPTIGLIL